MAMVESSFNLMGDIIDIRSTRTNIATFSAMQTVKHCLNSRKMTALEYFRKGHVKHDKVNGHLCRNFKTAAAAAYAEEKKQQKQQKEEALTRTLTARESREQSPAEEVPGTGSQGGKTGPPKSTEKQGY